VVILDRMMAKKPDDRYQTARDTAQALLEWLTANGGSAWARMNPAASGASQMYAGQGASGSNVLAGDLAAPSAGDAAAQRTSGGAALAGETRPDGGVLREIPSATPAPSTAAEFAPLQETARDPDLAAFLSHLADEGSTRIAGSGRTPQPDRAEPPPLTGPVEPDLEATLTAAQLSSPVEEIAPQVSEVAWPTTEPISFEPVPEAAPPEFAPTIVAPRLEEEASAPPTAVPVAQAVPATSRPPVAARIATPVRPGKVAVARPVAGVPVAEPVPATAAPAKKPAISRNVLIGGAAAAIVLLAVGGYLVFHRGGSTVPKEKDGGKQSVSKKDRKRKTEKDESEAGPLPERGEYTVGPAGKYRTIGAALAEIKRHPNNKSKKAVQIVKVAGGQTYAERIALDETWPRGIQLVAEPGPPPVLAPSGPDPIVSLRPAKENVQNFHLEGFHLDAAGKDVAVELAEWVPGTQLRRLEITGFAKSGVHINGAQTFGDERERIVLEKVVFRSGVPAAVGALFTQKSSEPRYVRVRQCRFLGPMDGGMRVESGIIGLEISESIFYQTVTGVKFIGEDRMWRDVVFAANTVFENDRGIVFTNMPGPQTTDLGFYNNLFFGSKTADAVVEKDFNERNFLYMYRRSPGGSGYNWTTRPRADPPKHEELPYLFETIGGGFDKQDVTFASVDPASPDFLAPTPTSPQRQVGSVQGLHLKDVGPQVGAIRGK
jgi:hypothetical protein